MKVILLNLEASPAPILPVMQEMLINSGHTCKYINISINNKYDQELLNDLAKQIATIGNNPGLIGISCMTNSFMNCAILTKHLRKYTDAKIIFGGIHPTVKPLEALEVADYVCVGEGEEALVELASRLENSERTDNIKNIYTKVDGKIIKNELRPLIQNLDELPVPNFRLDDLYGYYQGQILCLAQHQYLLDRMYQAYFIVTSRGCPYRCTYCLNSALINIDKSYIRLRRRSNLHVINELKNLRKAYQRPVTIGFVDDDFCAQSEANLEKFMDLYKQEIKLPFFVASTPSSISEKKMATLYNGGLARLEIGVQSANDGVNKEVYNRNASKKKLLEALNIVGPYSKKIRLCFDIILDNPWEDQATKLETLRFLYALPKPATIPLYSLCLYPGTDLYYRAVKEGRIKDEIDEIYLKNHMTDIGDDSINTLFLLFAKTNIPRFMMELLINVNKYSVGQNILKRVRYLFWEGPKLYRRVSDHSFILFRAILTGDHEGLKFYFNRIVRIIQA